MKITINLDDATNTVANSKAKVVLTALEVNEIVEKEMVRRGMAPIKGTLGAVLDTTDVHEPGCQYFDGMSFECAVKDVIEAQKAIPEPKKGKKS